jgi:hypothetical protein
MDIELIVAIYGLFQQTIKEQDFSTMDMSDHDAIALYKWLGENVKHLSSEQLGEKAKKFNKIVRELENEYYLNNFLMALYIFEDLVAIEGSRSQQLVLGPKLNRLIKHIRLQTGLEANRDSKLAASNVRRRFNNLPELTKKMREHKWKKIRNSI